MIIKLGESDYQDKFRFRIGDRVRTKVTERSGTVVDGEFYSASNVVLINYRIRMDNDPLIWNFNEDRIEPADQG